MPLTATIAPSSRARAAAATASMGGEPSAGAGGPPPARASASRGPHAGQAFGWAWKRRSRGSSYSAWQAAHIVKDAIVVDGPASGTAVTSVKRGPQLVQLMNG